MSTVTMKKLPSTARSRSASTEEVVHRITVTPEMAEGWLSKNTSNRPVAHHVVNRYARDLQSGSWRFTGDAIRFDRNGVVLDGQHRLLACVKAQTAFETLVIDGLPPEARDFMDMGLKRRASDALALRGIQNGNSLAAAAQWLIDIKSDWSKRKTIASTPEILALVEKHPFLIDSAKRIYSSGTKAKFVLGPRPTLSIVMHYIGTHLLEKPEEADEFVEVFQTGKPAYEGDPAQIWRERLIRHRSSGIVITRHVHYRGLVHAWNMFVRRQPAANFKVPNSVRIEGLDLKRI